MLTLITALLKLIAQIVSAAQKEGLGKEEVSVLGAIFNTIPAMDAVMARQATDGPMQANVLLIVESFAAALRRYHPQAVKNANIELLKNAVVPQMTDKFPKHVEAIFKEKLKTDFEIPEDFGDLNDAEVLSKWTGSPMDTPIYKTLWAAFAETTWHLRIKAQTEDVLYRLLGVQTGTALMTIEDTQGAKTPLDDFLIDIDGTEQGMGKRRFEALFQIEYVKRLGSRHIKEQEALITQRRLLYQEAIIRDMASWGENHVFGNIDRQTYKDSGDEFIPFLPLAQMYVEPTEWFVNNSAYREPEKGYVHHLAYRDNKIVAISAHFGMGKSLTSRTLAAKLAQNCLVDGRDAPIPVYIECRKYLLEENLATITEAAMCDALKDLGLDITSYDLAIPKFDHQRPYHFIFDGLDEIALPYGFLVRFVNQTVRALAGPSRCTIFSRPQALADIKHHEKVTIHSLESYTIEQVAQWTTQWNDITGENLQATQFKDVLDEGDRVPILLFMYAIVLRNDQTIPANDRTAIYEEFIRIIASGKYTIKGNTQLSTRHQPIQDAQAVLRQRLDRTTNEVLGPKPEGNVPDSAPMVWLFAQVAWTKHRMQWNDSDDNVAVAVDKMLTKKLGLKSVKTCLPGSIFAIQTDGKFDNILFKHKSFKEFLCAKRWMFALLKWMNGHFDKHTDNDLYDAPLTRRSEQNVIFLYDFIQLHKTTKSFNKHKAIGHLKKILDELEMCAEKPKPLTNPVDDISWRIRRVLFQVLCWLHPEGYNTNSYYKPNTDVFWALEFVEKHQNIKGLALPQVDFSYQNLNDANLEYANLEYANLNATKFKGAKLSGTKLNHACLDYAKLNRAYFEGAELNHAKLNYANLTGANLTNANLTDAKLKRAELNGAKLNRAKLNRAELIEANLTSAKLIDAELTYAFLNRANLSGSNLIGANLTNAKLNGAMFQDTLYNRTRHDPHKPTRWPEDFDPKKHKGLVAIEDLQNDS